MSNGSRLDYQLDGSVPLTETNQTTSRVNLYGNGLVMSGGETLLSDGVGATRGTTNGSNGVVWASGYTAFGQAVGQSGSTNNHYQWGAGSGYRSDGFGPAGALPVVKVGARYYDPEFGCFLTRDTDLTQSPYAYCGGDPVNRSDPSGHSWFSSFFNTIINAVKTVINAVVKVAAAEIRYIAANEFEFAIFAAIAPLLAPYAIGIFGATRSAAIAVGIVGGAISGFATAEVTGKNPIEGTFVGSLFFGSTYAGLHPAGPPNPNPLPPFPK